MSDEKVSTNDILVSANFTQSCLLPEIARPTCSENLLFADFQTCKSEMQGHTVPVNYSLIIEATAPAGGVAKFGQGVTELAVQLVSQHLWDTFPGHDEDDDDCMGTMVARTMTHQTKQLLCLTATTDHLRGNSVHHYFNFQFHTGKQVNTWILLFRYMQSYIFLIVISFA